MEDIVVTVLDTNYLPKYAENEQERINNETARIIAENERITNENARTVSEATREENEAKRITGDEARLEQYNLIQEKLDNGEFNGEDGADGQDGEDGYSPTVTTSKSGKTTTIVITDKNGDHTATILDGEDGSSATETDPIFSASPASDITSTDIANWDNKSDFSGDYDDLTNKPTIPDQLSDLSDDSTHRLVTDTEKTTWSAKSDFSGSYNDLTNKPTIPTVPTNVSAFTNDAGYLTSHQDISGKQDIIQYSTMPTASADILGKIAQYIGTTTSSYTNGYFYQVVSDGAATPTYSWDNIDVQDSSGGASYTAGTNIEITNANVINNMIPFEGTSGNGFVVGQKKANTTINTSAIGIGKNINASGLQTVVIGNNAVGSNQMNVAIGEYATADSSYGIAIGRNAGTHGESSTVIGYDAVTYQSSSIALGREANATQSNLFQIGSDNYPINKAQIRTSNGNKQLATQDYVDTAIATAITSALGGSY